MSAVKHALCKSVLLISVAAHVAAGQQVNIGLRIEAKLAGFAGKVTIYAKNLETGQTFDRKGADPVRTASTIKLAVMTECFFEAKEGKLKWEEPLKITAGEKVSGSGVVTELSDGIELPIKDLMHLMIVVSDNTATNLILNRITGDSVNTRMSKLGFTQTRVMRKILGDGNDLKPYPTGITQEGAKAENKRWGIGRSSPMEMVALLEKIYRGELVDKASSDEMLAVLKRQRDHQGIARDMKDVVIASKSGALDHLRSDVAIVYSKGGPIAMAITVEDLPEINYGDDNPGNLMISALSEILVDGLRR